MYAINKIVGSLISTAGFGMALVVAAVLTRVLGRRRLAGWAVLLALANFWIWSTPLMMKWMGVVLEAEFLVDGRAPSVESLPRADLIELHGGGMGIETNVSEYAEMRNGADRVWHSARLWKAGKAPKILVTSGSTDLSTEPLLTDLGIPKEAIIYDFGPRNTEEEAKAVAVHCSTSTLNFASTRPKVLVVTSAWHMKRTMLMYKKYAPNIEAVPAPCDFENTLGADKIGGWASLLPAPEAFLSNSVAFHEWLGYWGYKLLR
jgi:uncharacterized SAM-binding protein YcdF (DUF218 family)